MGGGRHAARHRASQAVARTAVVAALAAFVWLVSVAPARAADAGVVSDLNWGISPTDQERTVAELRELGAKWVRIHVGWKDFEQLKGVHNQWNLVHTGIAIDQARSAGARVVLMVHDAPAWASGSSASNVPRSPADYAEFVGFLARHYRGRVAAYEIWNEQNYRRFWSTGPDPAAYAALLKAAYPAIKAGDPDALVVYGGLSTNDWEFVRATYRAGVRGSFDVLATHPYPDCGASPDVVRRGTDGRMTRGTFLAYREVRATMLAHADDKPIWFTELGWSTSTAKCDPSAGNYVGGVSEQAQADYLRRVFELTAADEYVQVAMVYAFRNHYWAADADKAEARFGLVRADFSRKPAFYAVRDAALRAARTAPANGRPTVRVTAPAQGSAFRRSLTIRARAAGDRRVVRVEFRVNGRLLKRDTSEPYSYTWRGAKESRLGKHWISAVAWDAQGRAAKHAVVAIRTR